MVAVMATAADRTSGGTGTRFRIFPQSPYVAPFNPSETVRISPPPGSIGPGPSDARMYVIAARGKEQPYGFRSNSAGMQVPYLPPWTGEIRPPALPNGDGHFDHLEVGTAEFEAAHVYASVRRVLDIWEAYFGREIGWHFARDFDRLEISILPAFDNATMGYGFLEVGYHHGEADLTRPFTLNFDVLAHEVGHAIIYSLMGLPRPDGQSDEYFGFHESAADTVAMIAALHFDSVVDGLLESSRGNLYTFNRLNRIGELTEHEQLRLAANTARLSDFADGWIDEHDLSTPMTGAMFDILVDVFHEMLLDRRLITPEVEDLADVLEYQSEYADVIQALFDEAYGRDPAGFKAALLETRDILGCYLAEAWSRQEARDIRYEDVGDALLQVDLEATGGRYRRLIDRNLRLRDIGLVRIGPRLAPPGAEERPPSKDRPPPAATMPRKPQARLAYRERIALARSGMATESHDSRVRR